MDVNFFLNRQGWLSFMKKIVVIPGFALFALGLSILSCLLIPDARASYGDSETGPLNTVLPTMSDIVVFPAVASEGDLVTLQFNVSKPLAGQPEVTINERPAAFINVDGALRYTFEYTIHRNDPIGNALVVISGEDPLGNRGTLINVGALDIIKVIPVRAWPACLALFIAGVVLLMRKYRTITALVILSAAVSLTPAIAHAAQPQVSNVRFAQGPDGQGGTKVDIYYDLVAPGGSCAITVSLSKDGGNDGFPHPVTSLSGALLDVDTGQNHHIRWKISNDYPDEDIPDARIRITADEVFSFVFMTDTHLGMKCSETNLNRISQWIVNQAASRNIRYVGHLGDVCDERTATSLVELMQRARSALQPVVDAGIPCAIAIGNHDYRYLPEEHPRSAAALNGSNAFGPEFYAGMPWYGGSFEDETSEPGPYPGGTINHYMTQEIAGLSFLFLTLEHYPRDKVLDWADNLVMNVYPNHHVVVCTHAYLNQNGNLSTGSYSSAPPGPEFSNSGTNMWERYFKNWKNLRIVLNGHFIDEPRQAYREQTGTNGNVVHSYFFNYQNWGYRFGALYFVTSGGLHQAATIRIMTFYPASNKVLLIAFTPSANTVIEAAVPQSFEFIAIR